MDADAGVLIAAEALHAPELGGSADEPAAAPKHFVPADFGAVHDVPVTVQAVLGRVRMPVADLLRLKAGAVIELDRRVGEPVDILVNGRLVARGEVVLVDGALGVTLTEIVRAR